MLINSIKSRKNQVFRIDYKNLIATKDTVKIHPDYRENERGTIKKIFFPHVSMISTS